MKREIRKIVHGMRTVDGAGVSLTRMIGNHDVAEFDPFLMLDSFDSTNPAEYMEGFPFHPHRGIETVTYLINGEMEHQDSLGNKGVIKDGESQWMSAASGIMHQEMPHKSELLYGFQLWINLPQKDKMSVPTYMDVNHDMIKEVDNEDAHVRVIAGQYEEQQGVKPQHVDVTLLDVQVKENKTIKIPTKEEDNVFIFVIKGSAIVNGRTIEAKANVLFGEGDYIEVEANGKDTRFILFAGKPLKESIAWGGPIVMNTEEELDTAFTELRNGNFIKHNIKI